MTVPSLLFVIIGCIVAGLVHILERPWWRSGVMLLANLLFMASFSHNPVALAPFAGFLVLGYIFIRLLQAGRKHLFWVAVAVTLFLFFWLKKYTFIPAQLFIDKPYITVGLSYVFFRVMHLVIDAGQGVLVRRISVIDYANYTLNFPCIVAGPIQLYPDWEAGQTGRPSIPAVAEAGERIVIGLFKVMFVSALLDALQVQARSDVLIDGASLRGVLDGIQIVAIYAIYLYFNFSGYTDTVIGASRLMGLTLPENFDRPFTSTNFIEFWSRWHITLSTWLRTYVYSPLLMTLMRRMPQPGLAPALTVICFFVTFFLVGAWHGQTSEFLFFGVLQGGGVALNKLYQIEMAKALGRKRYRALGDNPVYTAVCRGLTFTWFAFTLMWFWGRWDALISYAKALGPAPIVLVLALIWLLATVILELMTRTVRNSAHFYQLNQRAVLLGSMLALLVLYTYIMSAPPPTVVYKAF